MKKIQIALLLLCLVIIPILVSGCTIKASTSNDSANNTTIITVTVIPSPTVTPTPVPLDGANSTGTQGSEGNATAGPSPTATPTATPAVTPTSTAMPGWPDYGITQQLVLYQFVITTPTPTVTPSPSPSPSGSPPTSGTISGTLGYAMEDGLEPMSTSPYYAVYVRHSTGTEYAQFSDSLGHYSIGELPFGTYTVGYVYISGSEVWHHPTGTAALSAEDHEATIDVAVEPA